MSKIREPAVAGMFYPSDPVKLKDEIDLLLSVAEPELKYKSIYGIISPHAGYIYSGRTAAYGFNLIKEKEIDTVIIISPSHREYFPGISIYNGEGYRTPLGLVEINQQLAEELVSDSKTIYRGIEGHKTEHAVEVQIPFLQRIKSDFKIVPVVMGDQGGLFIDELVSGLMKINPDKVLIVASSDLSHYYTREDADKLDTLVEQRISDFKPDELQKDFELKNCEACGAGPIVTLMKAAQQKNYHSVVLNRSDSADTSGDFNEVVGYLSAAFYSN